MMKKKKIIGILLGLALIAVFVFQLLSNKKTAEEKVYHFDKEEPIGVEIQKIVKDTLDNELFYTGIFEANRETKISAEVQGRVNHLLVDLGNVVKKGDILIKLDNSLLQLQLQSINIQIEGLESDVARYTILSQSDAIQAVQLEKAILGLKSAKVQKQTLIEQINKSIIRAPFNGIIASKFTEVGAFAAPGIPLLQIIDIDLLKFTINISEKELSQFKLNNSYAISIDAFPDKILDGKVDMIGSKANMASSFPVQFVVKNLEEQFIKAGMFGKVSNNSIELNKPDAKVFSIPSSAIIGNADQAQVYLVKNGKATLKNIQISNKVQNKSIVSEGLNDGDTLIVNGLINLFEGANVAFK